MKKKFFLLSLLIIVLLLMVNKLSNKSGIYFSDKEKYQLQETYEKTSEIFRGLYQFDKNYVRLEINRNIDSQQASLLIKTKANKFEQLFQNDMAPYPGEVSKVTTCNEEYKPKSVLVNGNLFYKAYLNSRNQFGSCIEEQLPYRGVIGYIYCSKEKYLYQIEYFLDKNSIDGEQKINNFISNLKSF